MTIRNGIPKIPWHKSCQQKAQSGERAGRNFTPSERKNSSKEQQIPASCPYYELIRQLIENTFEDIRNSPAAEPLEHAVPVAGTLRKIAPGRSRPGPPKHGFKKLPIVRRSASGIGRRAKQHGLDSHPHGVDQYRSVCIHLATCSICQCRRFSVRCGKSGNNPPKPQPD